MTCVWAVLYLIWRNMTTLSIARQNKLGVERLQIEARMADIIVLKRFTFITASKKPGIYYMPAEPLLVHELLDAFEGRDFEVQSDVAEWLEGFEAAVSISLSQPDWHKYNVPIPTTVDHREYQLGGAAWFHEVRRGVLADPTGIGKTIQALLAIELLIAEHKDSTRPVQIVIVCPKYLAMKWERACQKFVERSAAACIYGTKDKRLKSLQQSVEVDKNTFTIINYDMMLKAKFPILFRQRQFTAVIFDEAHYLQGRKSIRFKNANLLVNDRQAPIKNVLMLTATPYWNRPDSIWALLHILQPGRFTSYWQFARTYCLIEETEFGPKIMGPNPDKQDKLKWVVGPMVLRREKADVLPELPKIIHKYLDYKPHEFMAKEYAHITKWMRDNGRMNLAWLRKYMIMRNEMEFVIGEGDDQVEVPKLYDREIPNTKLESMMGFLEDNFNHKAVIFTFHRETTEFLCRFFKARAQGWVNYIHGGISSELRQQRTDEFVTTEDPAILVGTIGAISTGIDLECADLSCVAEHPWLCAEMEQMEGRIERYGQQGSPVMAHFMGWNTIEQYVFEVCMEKSVHTSELMAMEEVKRRTIESLVDF